MYNSNLKMNQSPIILHNCGFTTVSDWNYPERLVTTTHWRCYLNDCDGALLWHGIKKTSMSSNRVYLIAPGTAFKCASNQVFNQLYFHFSLAWPDGIQVRNFIHSIPLWQEAEAFMREMAKRKTSLSKTQSFLAALGFLHTALAKLPDNVFVAEEKLDPRIKSVITLLSGTVVGHFSNRQLAEKVGMSENGFIRLFSRCVGKAPQDFYRELRIERACWLLRNSANSIELIAIETGFVDRYHFSRVFKQIMGENPAAYRRKKQTKSDAEESEE
jgi:AraC-like DNA-binding protein